MLNFIIFVYVLQHNNKFIVVDLKVTKTGHKISKTFIVVLLCFYTVLTTQYLATLCYLSQFFLVRNFEHTIIKKYIRPNLC